MICKLVGDGLFVRFPFLDEQFTRLRLLVTQRDRLKSEEIRFKNRLQAVLDLAWPEFLEHFFALTKRTPKAVLERWPLPEDLLAASPRTVRSVVKQASRNHIPRETVDALIASARKSVALRSAAHERRSEILHLLERWALVERHKEIVDREIAELVEAIPAARILTSIPEVSTLCAATIVSEIGTPEDFDHPRQILKLAGMNLVERSSGLSIGRSWQSKRGRPALRRQLFLLAGRWCTQRGLYRDDYLEMLSRNGHSKTKAVAAIARKLVPLLLSIMTSGEPFDLERWQRSRHRRPVIVK